MARGIKLSLWCLWVLQGNFCSPFTESEEIVKKKTGGVAGKARRTVDCQATTKKGSGSYDQTQQNLRKEENGDEKSQNLSYFAEESRGTFINK